MNQRANALAYYVYCLTQMKGQTLIWAFLKYQMLPANYLSFPNVDRLRANDIDGILGAATIRGQLLVS